MNSKTISTAEEDTLHKWLIEATLAQCADAGAKIPVPDQLLARWRAKLNLMTYAYVFGQPPVPLCAPDSNGRCRVESSNHGDNCSSPGKVPLKGGWQEKEYQPDCAYLDRYVQAGANWGIRLGDGLVELDIDSEKTYQEFMRNHGIPGDAPIEQTGRGYKIFLMATRPIANNFRLDGVEVRVNGMSVVPESLHPSGKRYKWLKFTGILPTVDLEGLLGISAPARKERYRGGGSHLSEYQQSEVGKILMEYLPGARRVGGSEIAGYIDLDSKSKAHIKVNTAKGCYMDWRTEKGGTVQELLRRLGAPVPKELGGMGEDDIPEYMPIWAIDKDWYKNGWKCGRLTVVKRKDGIPKWSGRLVCMQWDCPECAIRQKNILKRKLRKLSNVTVLVSPPNAGKILAKCKRQDKELLYARAKNRDAEYLLVRSGEIGRLLSAGFTTTTETAEQVVNGLPYAIVGRRQRRFINSPRFWRDEVNNNTLPKIKKEEGQSENEERSFHMGSNNSNSDIDLVILDTDYKDVLKKLQEYGFQLVDTGLGDTHLLRGDQVVEPEELGTVIDVISLGGIDPGPPVSGRAKVKTSHVKESTRMKPNGPCYACGKDNWWQRKDGGWVCGRCHPKSV